MSSANPFQHLVRNLKFSSRDAILTELIEVWKENQDRRKADLVFNSILRMKNAPTDLEFNTLLCRFVMWMDCDGTTTLHGTPVPLDPAIIESSILSSAESFIDALPFEHYRVTITVGSRKINFSDPTLNWKGPLVSAAKARELAGSTRLKGYKYAVYIKYKGEAWRISKINQWRKEMSCESPQGGFAIKLLEEWSENGTQRA